MRWRLWRGLSGEDLVLQLLGLLMNGVFNRILHLHSVLFLLYLWHNYKTLLEGEYSTNILDGD